MLGEWSDVGAVFPEWLNGNANNAKNILTDTGFEVAVGALLDLGG
jgi:hypothetical protein